MICPGYLREEVVHPGGYTPKPMLFTYFVRVVEKGATSRPVWILDFFACVLHSAPPVIELITASFARTNQL